MNISRCFICFCHTDTLLCVCKQLWGQVRALRVWIREHLPLCEHHQSLTMTIKQNWHILTLHKGQRFLPFNQVHKLFSFAWRIFSNSWIHQKPFLCLYPVKRYKLIWPLKHYLERKITEEFLLTPPAPVLPAGKGAQHCRFSPPC